ncbi:MAG TPA: CoA-binding protein [Flavobacteriaceae bacterium]|nr:CoA-binding protein [Flavobacteriaceae bacterium]
MSKKTLVLGASLKAERYSNIAIKMLLEYEYPVIALGLRKGSIKNVEILTDLNNAIINNIHTVTLYLNAKRQVDYYDFIIDLKPKRVIFNPGTENWGFMELLNKNKIEYEVACTLVLLRTEQY